MRRSRAALPTSASRRLARQRRQRSSRAAYQRYLVKFAGPEWERLRDRGAWLQRPLWASTITKNPAYSEVLNASELIGPDGINTMPTQTLRASPATA